MLSHCAPPSRDGGGPSSVFHWVLVHLLLPASNSFPHPLLPLPLSISLPSLFQDVTSTADDGNNTARADPPHRRSCAGKRHEMPDHSVRSTRTLQMFRNRPNQPNSRHERLHLGIKSASVIQLNADHAVHASHVC